MVVQSRTVGIFSRDGQENYKWLMDLLKSWDLDCRPVYISNNPRPFLTALSSCTYAILYHTKNRGRVNVTNVTDSLYDRELQDLYDSLGRNNVLVLLDDMEDSSKNNKERILREQPTIGKCADKLIVISETEKESYTLDGSYPTWSLSPTSPLLQDAFESMKKKVKELQDFLSEDSNDNPGLHSDNSSGSSVHRIQDNDNRTFTSRSSTDNDNRTFISRSSTDRGPEHDWSKGAADGNSSRGYRNYDDNPEEDKLVQEGSRKPDVKAQSRRFCNLPDKVVFGLVGGGIGLLVIIFIVVLCVTL